MGRSGKRDRPTRLIGLLSDLLDEGMHAAGPAERLGVLKLIIWLLAILAMLVLFAVIALGMFVTGSSLRVGSLDLNMWAVIGAGSGGTVVGFLIRAFLKAKRSSTRPPSTIEQMPNGPDDNPNGGVDEKAS